MANLRDEQGDLPIQSRRAERGAVLLETLRALGEVDEAFTAALEADPVAALPIPEHEGL